jgi:hypothetical protein
LLHDTPVKLYLPMQRKRGQTMAEYAVVLAVIASASSSHSVCAAARSRARSSVASKI